MGVTYWIIKHERLNPTEKALNDIKYHLEGGKIEEVLVSEDGSLIIKVRKEGT